MSRAAPIVLLLALGACRIQTTKWGGTPPRLGKAVRIALDADVASGAAVLAHQVLRADPRVELVAYDGARDGNAQHACAWAREHGLDYYVRATFTDTHKRNTECVAWAGSLLDLLDNPKGPSVCAKEIVKAEWSESHFALTFTDAQSCRNIPALSQLVDQYVNGGEEATAEARARVEAEAPISYKGFPDQVVVTPAATADTPIENGDYALFRQRIYQGGVRVAREGQDLRMLHCCHEPHPGDVLVRRGTVRYLAFDLTFDSSLAARSGDRESIVGAGVRVRRYALWGGLQLAAGTNIIGASRFGYYSFYVEPGWAWRPSSAIHLSANLGLGGAYVVQNTLLSDQLHAIVPVAIPTARVEVELATWWYAGLDLGYVLAPTVDSWEGGSTSSDVRIRGPLARLFVGLSL